MRLTTILPLLTAFAATLPAQWQQITPTLNPTQRRAGAMAFEPGTNRMIMYGGLSASPSQSLNDTWAYNGGWSQLNPPGGAPARWGHQMVTNTASGSIITFGGRSPTISGLSADTFEWDGASWSTIPTSGAPSARFLYGMCYDSQRGVVVLFGGRDSAGANNETWEFNGISWQQVLTANSPSPREEMGMVFDPSLNRTILFGGCDEGTASIYGDTWWYDGNDWINVTPANSPTPRFRGAMAFDSVRSRSIYFGGYDGSQLLTETFEYSGGEWALAPNGSSFPSNSTETISGFDDARGKFVVFGGYGGSFSNDTWEYTGDTSGLFSLYGSSCDTVNGTPDLSGSTPTIGTPLDLTFNNLGSSLGVIVVLGLSSETWQGNPLPFDLGLVGLPGCGLLASPDFLDVSLATTGSANYSLTVPNDTSLINLSVYCQGIVINIAPFLVFEGATRGGRALLGN